MPDFRNYQDEQSRRRSLLWGAAAAVGVAAAVPSVRHGIGKMVLQGAERLGGRFVGHVPRQPLQNMAAEMRSLLRKTLPRAARQTLGEERAYGLMTERLVRTGVAQEVAQKEAASFVRTGSFRQFIMDRRAAPDQLFLHDDILEAMQARLARTGEAGQEAFNRHRNQLSDWFTEIKQQLPDELAVRSSSQYRRVEDTVKSVLSDELRRMGEQSHKQAQKMGKAFGVVPITVGELPAQYLTPGLESSIAYLRHVMPGEVVNALPVGHLFRAGDDIIDLSRAASLGNRFTSWMKQHVQIPLAPGAMGISPFQLFPWTQGNLHLQFSHINRQSRDPLLRAVAGEGRDIFKLGERWLAADFTAAADQAAEILPMRGDVWTGLYGYRARRAKAINAALEAEGSEHKSWWGGFGNQYGDHLWGRMASVWQKFDPESTWAPNVLKRVIEGEQGALQNSDVRRAAGFLSKGKLSRNLQDAMAREAAEAGHFQGLLGPDAGEVLRSLHTDDGVWEFLQRAQARDHLGRQGVFSPKLRDFLNQVSANPEQTYRRLEPAVDRSVFGYNIFGRPDDKGFYQLGREAAFDEIEERLARGLGIPDLADGEGHFVQWLEGRNLQGAERVEALAYAHGKEMSRRLQDTTRENPIHWAADYLRQNAGAQEVAEQYVARNAKLWETHVEGGDQILHTSRLFSQKSYHLLEEFNRAVAGGASWDEAMSQVWGGGWGRQVRAFFTGNPLDVTDTTLAMEYFPRRLNELLGEVGLGLPAQDLYSGWSTLKALMVKRVAPAVAAYEAYRYLDFEAEQWGVAGPSDLYANARSRMGLFRARNFGTRLPFLGDRDLFPGLDKFLPERTEQEEWEHQQGGWEAVRKGRFWSLGSRSEFWGDKVSYWAPSAVAAARSDWQSAENVDLNTRDYWAHSPIPNPQNMFLGPLGPWLTDPYWWERKHSMGENPERPYPVSAPRFDPHTPHGVLGNLLLGWTKPRQVLAPDAVPISQGGNASQADLRRINEAMKNGSDLNGLLGLVGPSGAGGGAAAGGGTGGGEAGFYSPGVVPPSEGFWGGFAKVTPAGQLKLVNVPGSISQEEFASLGQYPSPGKARLLSRQELTRINQLTTAGAGGMTPMKGGNILRMTGKLDTGYTDRDLEGITGENGLITAQRNLGDLTGLYGFMVEQAWRPEQRNVVLPDPMRALSYNQRFYDLDLGGLGGNLSEFGRRFIPRSQQYRDWNPVQSSAAAAWYPGSEYFLDLQHGDIYSKIPKGEQRLGGEAYERLHPQVKILQTRASSLGHSVEDIMREMLFLEEPLSEYAERVTGIGDVIHQKLQAHWKRMGILVAAENKIYDERLGISGHFDAVLAMQDGLTVGEIKTVSQRRFDEAMRLGGLPEHRSQLNFYLHETGLDRGLLFYINRDDPGQVQTFSYGYDAALFRKTVHKVEEARQRLLAMTQKGLISRGDLYDPVSRFEILADVAPYSENYALLREYLTRQNAEGELEPDANRRFQAAKERAAALKQRTQLYNYRFQDISLKGQTFTVEEILDPTRIRVREQDAPIRLAGIERPSEGQIEAALGTAPEGMTPAEWMFQKYGIHPGARIQVKLDSDPLRATGGDIARSSRGVVFYGGQNINQALLRQGIAPEDQEDFSSPGVVARFSAGEIAKGKIWERFAHLDTPFHTKFLRVRSPLEELQRTVVYGKNTGGWQTAFQDYVLPSLESFTARDPLLAAGSAGIFATFFFRTTSAKLKAAMIGAGVGGALSLNRMVNEATTGEAWKPHRTRRREELEEYWDVLKYVKARHLAAQEEALAQQKEGTNLDRLVRETYYEGKRADQQRRGLEQEKRELLRQGREGNEQALRRLNKKMDRIAGRERMVKLGPHGTQALVYRQSFRSTLYGADPGLTPFSEIMRALPKYKREIIAEAVAGSNQREREQIYRLLPKHERRVLAPYLGVKSPQRDRQRPELRDYFKRHPLPGGDWKGWRPEVNLEDLRIQALEMEGLDPFESGVFPQQVAEAKERTGNTPIPMDQGSTPDLQRRLNLILSGKGVRNGQVTVDMSPHDGAEHDIQIRMHLHQNREAEIKQQLDLMHF